MKLTEIQLLKNLKIFALQARYQTSLVYWEELQKEDLKHNNRKLMMLKILEEFVSSTEDLAMWLIAISKHNDSGKFGLLDQLLMADVPTKLKTSKKNKNKHRDEVVKILQGFNRVSTPNGLLRKLHLVSIDKLTSASDLTGSEFDQLLNTVLRTIKLTIQHRRENSSLLVRFHNKVKHGMTVFLDPENINKLLIIDVQKNKQKRIMDLSVNIEKAELALKNIDSIAKTISILVELRLLDYKYRINHDKKLSKRRKQTLLDHIEQVEF